jgi:anti-sigma B factor antagonist
VPQTLVFSDSTASRVEAMPPVCECTLRDGGLDAAWVHAVGELDLATAQQLEQTLRLAELRAQRVVLDLRELDFMDCSGMHVIVDASIRARRPGRRLVLVRGPSRVDRVLTLTGASDVLEIVDLDPVQPPVQALVQLAQEGRAA